MSSSLKEGDKVVATAKNKADGSVVFPAIKYGCCRPHTHTITEKLVMNQV